VRYEEEEPQQTSTKRESEVPDGDAALEFLLIDGKYPQPDCGVWGKLRSRPPADYSLLYLVFREEVLGERKEREPPMPADELAEEITSSAFDRARHDLIDVDEERTEEIKQKCANSEFVDGLDDIDKLFEEIEPPDELDVGAVGSSMQEVLMGQGSRIVLKRVLMGIEYIRRFAVATKDKIMNYVLDEEGNFVLFEKDEVRHAAEWIVDRSKELFQSAKDLMEGIFDSFGNESEDDVSFQYERPQPNQASDDSDMQELLRQYAASNPGR
jgi:hypothetical protein